jgi:parallel beta-helix repeat protein
MRNCQALDNFSDGIWFDWHNYEATIEGCVMENNARAGLTLEASTHDELDGVPVRTALVTGCRIQNNESGIYSYGSRNVHIDGCVISNNCGEYGGQISVGGDSRVVYNEPQISTGRRIHNSAIYATEPTQQLVRFWTYGGLQTSPSYDWYTTVESDSNQWFHPGRTDAFPDPDAAMIGVSLTLEQWRTQTGNDLHSTWGVPDTATGFAPTATFTGSCSGGGIPRTVSLDASSSFDANGTLVDYAWQFGDGTTGSGVTCTHTFDYANRYEIALTVTDNEGLTHTVRNLLPIDELAAANGSVLLERWLDAPGGAISDIPLDRAPDESVLHTSLSFSTSSEDNYATRISGYLFPPQTGAYTFWITSDDQSELWLSPNDNALQKQRLSYVPEWAQGGEYTKYPSQRSE